MKPALPSPIDYQALLKLIYDDNWGMQPKLNGTRLFVSVVDGKVTGYSRKGTRCDVPRAVSVALSSVMPNDPYILDGELMGPVFNVFDLARPTGTTISGFVYRRTLLENISRDSTWWGPLAVVKTAFGTEAKGALIKKVLETGTEGIVARRLDAPYREGRSKDVLKWKRVLTIDAVVREGTPGKQNFNLVLFDEEGKEVSVGAVSALTGDGPRLTVGQVVEVEYFGASKSWKLISAVTPRLRTDKDPSECLTSQLVYVNKDVL